LPDVVLYLNITIEESMKRGEFGEERYEKKEFQEKVADKFEKLAENNWKIIDASKSREELHDEIYELAVKVIETPKKNKEIQKLWVK